MFAGSLLFVLGFSFVFVSFGALIGGVGEWLFTYERPITVVLGSLTILLGLVFLGVVPWMQRDWRCTRSRRSASLPHRCSACSSGSAGRRASARR